MKFKPIFIFLLILINCEIYSQLVINEIFYDAIGSDIGYEWIELYNTSSTTINLSGVCIQSGGANYSLDVDLSSLGTMEGNSFVVIGGPLSDASNGSPVFDLIHEFNGSLQNSGPDADAVALLSSGCSVIIDALIYGETNSNSLADEANAIGIVDVADAVMGQSIGLKPDGIRVGGAYIFSDLTPGSSNDLSEPDSDGDNVPDISDNCPDIPNPDQYDLDEDGIGDDCDTNQQLNPIAKFENHLFVDKLYSGIMLKSPGGTCWVITIADDGSLKTTQVTCPR